MDPHVVVWSKGADVKQALEAGLTVMDDKLGNAECLWA